MIDHLKNLFRRPKETPSHEMLSGLSAFINRSDGPTITKPELMSNPCDLQYPYEYGHIVGYQGVDAGAYAEYLTCSALEDHLQKKLETVKRLRAAFDEKRAHIVSLHENIGVCANEVGRLDEAKKAFEKRRSDLLKPIQQMINGAVADLNKNPQRASLLYFVVFFVPGVYFLLTEYHLSLEIVADALEFTGQAAQIFAIGICLLAVLLKPAYDRLVEEPYWTDQKKNIFQWVILATSGLTLATLYVLGLFRSEAYASNLQQEAIMMSDILNPGEKQALLVQAQDTLLNGWFVNTSFIMSGILFALAGAICFGISLRHLKDWYQFRFKPGLWRMSVKLREMLTNRTIKAMEEALTEKKSELAKLEANLKQQPSPETLDQGLVELNKERETLLETLKEAEAQKAVYHFKAGYGIGRQQAKKQEAKAALALTDAPWQLDRPAVALRKYIFDSKMGNTPQA